MQGIGKGGKFEILDHLPGQGVDKIPRVIGKGFTHKRSDKAARNPFDLGIKGYDPGSFEAGGGRVAFHRSDIRMDDLLPTSVSGDLSVNEQSGPRRGQSRHGGSLILKPDQVQCSGSVFQAYPEKFFTAGEKGLFPAEDHIPRDLQEETVLNAPDGGDDPAVFITPRDEEEKIEDRMKALSGEGLDPLGSEALE